MSDWFPRMVADAADTFYVGTDEILARGRVSANATDARHCIAWAARRQGLALTRIGQRLGRDHTTILSAVRRVDASPQLLPIARGLAARHPRGWPS